MSSLGTRLRALRDKVGWTQIHAAKQLGLTNVQLSRYESDIHKPDPDTLAKMSEMYEVSLDWLLTGQHSTNETSTEDDSEFTPAEKKLMDSLRNEPKYSEFLRTATDEEWAAFIDTIKKLVRGSID